MVEVIMKKYLEAIISYRIEKHVSDMKIVEIRSVCQKLETARDLNNPGQITKGDTDGENEQ